MVERRKRGIWTLEGLENFVFCFLFYGKDWTIMTSRKEMGVELFTTKTTMNKVIKKKTTMNKNNLSQKRRKLFVLRSYWVHKWRIN